MSVDPKKSNTAKTPRQAKAQTKSQKFVESELQQFREGQKKAPKVEGDLNRFVRETRGTADGTFTNPNRGEPGTWRTAEISSNLGGSGRKKASSESKKPSEQMMDIRRQG